MNTGRGTENFKNFLILLEIGCSSKNLMGRLVVKFYLEKGSVMQWNMQAGNITFNLKVKLDFALPELSTANVVTVNFIWMTPIRVGTI